MLRQGINRRYVSDIDRLLQTLHQDVCSKDADAQDTLTKERERSKYEDVVFPQRDLVNVPRLRTKRWEDEKEDRKNLGG